MSGTKQAWGRDRSIGLPTILSADLMKLRSRFLAVFPDQAALADRLARVPVAFRHLLTLKLELSRLDALPRRYRDLAEAVLRAEPGMHAWDRSDPDLDLPHADHGDAVDRDVIAFTAATAAGDPSAAVLLGGLRRYFTTSQLYELTLIVTQGTALIAFERIVAALAAETLPE